MPLMVGGAKASPPHGPEWNLLGRFCKSKYVRVVTIKHPPTALDGPPSDNPVVGKVYDVSPHLAILMIAAGWMRGETRNCERRHEHVPANRDRREVNDRRSQRH